ncbi:hypothetical protein Y032_0023g804 [Ancylostoma ceylanicum]|nr:hypothetical protein Y032_0023g804 [Ancylostoma ceylanicum]
MSSSNAMQAALEDLDRCDIATLLHHLLPRLDAIDSRLNSIDTRLDGIDTRIDNRHDASDAMLETILERTAPKSNCVFCEVDENRDSHHSGRCSRYPDPVSRTAQATRLGLCLRCLKGLHRDECDETPSASASSKAGEILKFALPPAVIHLQLLVYPLPPSITPRLPSPLFTTTAPPSRQPPIHRSADNRQAALPPTIAKPNRPADNVNNNERQRRQICYCDVIAIML